MTSTASPLTQVRPTASILGAPVRYAAGRRRTLVGADVLAEHWRRFGELPADSADLVDLVDLLERESLTGRGGAHVLAARKWRAVQRASRTPGDVVVVANGAESEPLSRKDITLLELRPHLVLDGLSLAARSLGAGDIVLWLHASATSARTAVLAALAERRREQADHLRVRVVMTPDHYLAGESSAVVRGLSGGPALPQFMRAHAAERGVDGRPTLVHNVETLARIALLARGHAAAHTALLSVALDDTVTVIELAPGQPIARALEASALSTGREQADAVAGSVPPSVAGEPYAALVGGYGGSWMRWTTLRDLPADETALRAAGGSLGAGIIAPVMPGDCGLRRAAAIARTLAASSARQCGPCARGLPSAASALGSVAELRGARRDSKRLQTYLAEIRGRGACGHPDGAVRMIASALDVYEDDVHAHLHGRCLHAPGRT